MKKPTLIFFLLLFAACAVGGYMLASKSRLGSSNNSDAGSINAATSLAAKQQNYLLVRGDDLTAADPKIVEAWMVFTLYSDPPQIMFLPIYPRYDEAQNNDLTDAFALDSQGDLNGKLVSKVSEMFKVTINGYILTDAAGMNAIASWFGIDGITAGTYQPQSDQEKHAVLLNGQTFLQKVCSQIKNGKAIQQYASIYWSQLIPNHFQTDMSFEQLTASWERVAHASPPQQCDVLSSE
jgi:anionic cell wall polymer biosynthesis LytR-Cps2A-Psr (LCP) family protein